jgi:hypothetical protein
MVAIEFPGLSIGAGYRVAATDPDGRTALREMLACRLSDMAAMLSHVSDKRTHSLGFSCDRACSQHRSAAVRQPSGVNRLMTRSFGREQIACPNAARNRRVLCGCQGGIALSQALCRNRRQRMRRGSRRPGWTQLRALNSAEGPLWRQSECTLSRFGPNACPRPITHISNMEPCSLGRQNRNLPMLALRPMEMRNGAVF